MKKLIAVIIILFGLFFMIKGWWDSQLSSVSNDKSAKIFIIDKGASLSQISKDLKKANLIKSDWAFNILAKQSGLSDKIQAGTFRLAPIFTAQETIKALTSQPLDQWVTLLEGWRKEEIAKKLNEQLGIEIQEFLKVAKEGYMFPDTYLFPKDYSPEQIAKKLKDTFEEKYSDQLRKKIKALGLTEEQGVILASIVEREARSDKVRTEVASILLKRFKINMGLNADATLQYILGYQQDEKSWWKRNLAREDKKVDSPYNTYLYRGLPPAPICNPSLSSLTAVANADPSTPYLYYYHDSKGNSYYGKTLEEHNQNVVNNP